MKKKIILSISIMLITLFPALSFPAEKFGNKTHMLSVQAGLMFREAQYREHPASYGLGWEFRNKNTSFCCDFFYAEDSAIMLLADMAFYFDTRPQKLHLFAGGGGGLWIPGGVIFPGLFTGASLDISREASIFAKIKFLLGGGEPVALLYFGITIKM